MKRGTEAALIYGLALAVGIGIAAGLIALAVAILHAGGAR